MCEQVCGQANRLLWFHPEQAEAEERPEGADPAWEGPPVRLALLGPPGVGKGTQAAMLCRRYRACHLATGDLFRAASGCETPSPAMRDAQAAMRAGGLVSDETVTQLVRERSGCLSCGGGFLLDGFPRTLSQAEALSALLDGLGLALDGVVLYELSEEAITRRLAGRRTCPACNAVYHVASRPPSRPGLCDACGGELVQRDDDQPDVIRARFATYREATEPLRDYYQGRGELVPVPAEGAPDVVYRRTRRTLESHRALRETCSKG